MTTNEDRAKEHLLDWLRDAHAMEEQAETMLKGMAGRLEHYPVLRQRIEQHIVETQGQARQVASCLERIGGSNSALKDTGGKMMAAAQNFSGMFASDEVVKGALFSYAFEHMEIASYRSLVAAARLVGDQATADICAGILAEEEAMAKWLEEHMDQLTAEFLQRSRQGEPAKR
ncbi:ferritin-like domain-containing protein [Orrella sp. JC864]|uniref:ferritin-like domain-containing protein n=1 Tax=Orrella sp. JC864 TaxID=3120298 RepID=UPI0012BCB00D